MRKTFMASMLALLLAVNHMQAALGETESQIVKRYGKPTAPPMGRTNKDVTEFFRNKDLGYTISVTFLNGQSQRETFVKDGKKPFNDKEIQDILDKNSDGTDWTVMNETDEAKMWLLGSKSAFAGYMKKEGYLSLETRLMLEFEGQVKALQQKMMHEQKQSGTSANPDAPMLQPQMLAPPSQQPVPGSPSGTVNPGMRP